jgi:hypothetical protein
VHQNTNVDNTASLIGVFWTAGFNIDDGKHGEQIYNGRVTWGGNKWVGLFGFDLSYFRLRPLVLLVLILPSCKSFKKSCSCRSNPAI